MNFHSPPVILPVPENGQPRPFWSVMIPAYNPPADYLEQALRGVLAQDPGSAQMQIEVVDDHSPKVDVAALVGKIAGDRVKVSQTPKNLGLAGCWNTCIERARGEWVHVLHQDDLVLPGFYESLRKVAGTGEKFGAAFCRHIFMDAEGHWLFLSAIEQRQAGPLPNALERLAEYQRIQTPSVVVRRDVYSNLGGFNSELTFALDWEMWCRIAAHYQVWYEPQPLAIYRSHVGSESSRMQRDAEDIRDTLRCIENNVSQLPPEAASRVRKIARANLAVLALQSARRMVANRQYRPAWAQTRNALACSCSAQVAWNSLGIFCAGLKAGLKHALSSPTK